MDTIPKALTKGERWHLCILCRGFSGYYSEGINQRNVNPAQKNIHGVSVDTIPKALTKDQVLVHYKKVMSFSGYYSEGINQRGKELTTEEQEKFQWILFRRH